VPAAFRRQHIAPDTLVFAEPLPPADDTKPGPLVEAEARLVLGEDPGLDRPDAGSVEATITADELEVNAEKGKRHRTHGPGASS
jgi:hypothetical protein